MQWLRRRAAASQNAQEDADIFRAAVVSAFWAHQFAHNRLPSAQKHLPSSSPSSLSSLFGPAADWAAGRRLLYEGQRDSTQMRMTTDDWAQFDKERAGAALIGMRRDERRMLVDDCLALQCRLLFAEAKSRGWGDGDATPYPPSHAELRRRRRAEERKRSGEVGRGTTTAAGVNSGPVHLSREEETRMLLDAGVEEAAVVGTSAAGEHAPAIPAELFQPGLEIPHIDGFTLQTRKSRIEHEESGYGLFVDGVVCPGTVVALYPGSVYFARQLTEEITRDNDYMISRYDGAVVDGRDWGERAVELVQRSRALRLAGGADADYTDQLKRFKNPFALGNHINHPPPGEEPNVMACAFDFTASDENPRTLPEELQPFIPNNTPIDSLLYRQSGLLQRAVVLIATRPLKDEELLLNYRYNPAHPYPDWYAQPDEEEAIRRWAKPVILGGILGGR
jgi:hypothetical protein